MHAPGEAGVSHEVVIRVVDEDVLWEVRMFGWWMEKTFGEEVTDFELQSEVFICVCVYNAESQVLAVIVERQNDSFDIPRKRM